VIPALTVPAAAAATGAGAVGGSLLAFAGAVKLASPGRFATSLRTLVPAAPVRRLGGAAAVAVGVVEIGIGVCLAMTPGVAGTAAAVVATALCLAFVLAVVRAIRLGAGCSCFGSLGRTRAGGREVGRATGLLAVCATLAALDLGAQPSGVAPAWGPASAAGAAATVIVIALAMVLGERLHPAARPIAAAGATARLARRALEVAGLDDQLATSLSPPTPPPLLPGSYVLAPDVARALAADVAGLPEAGLIAEHLAARGCRPPQWTLASAVRPDSSAGAIRAEPPASAIRPEPPPDTIHPVGGRNSGQPRTAIVVPTEPGCTLTAFLAPGVPPLLVGCHSGHCAIVLEGAVVEQRAPVRELRRRPW
jgi:methylamine utilization protein MauE